MEDSLDPPDESTNASVSTVQPGAPPGGFAGQLDHNYEVGYKKPPKHSQFQKGQSGNRNGRPRKSRNLIATFNEVLEEKVTLTVNGRRRKIPKIEVALTQVMNGAAKGDLKAMQTLIRMTEVLLRHAKLLKPQAKPRPEPQVVLTLPDNGKIPELTRRLEEAQAKVTEEFFAEVQRKAGRQGPANDDWEKEVA